MPWGAKHKELVVEVAPRLRGFEDLALLARSRRPPRCARCTSPPAHLAGSPPSRGSRPSSIGGPISALTCLYTSRGQKSLLHDNERHGGRAALLRGQALHDPSRVVRRASFRRVLPSLSLSSLVTISSPISSKRLLHDDGRHGGRVPLPRRHAHCACIHAVRRAPLRRAPSPLSLSDVNCFNLSA